jgi:predicted ATPase/DNA-binding winged helix-turn-helix (wHTH) protein
MPARSLPDRTTQDMHPPGDQPSLTGSEWTFGAYVLRESQRRLEREGKPVRLGSRSFDILLQLLRRAGEVVSKDELLASVWAGIVVEEASVRVHMSTLRKALAEADAADATSSAHEWIASVPLKGYSFTGRVTRRSALPAPAPAPATLPAAEPFTPPPLRLTALVGREADAERLLQALQQRRLVTVVGLGGIGKTSLAIRVAGMAQCPAGHTSSATAFADLASLACGDHVLGTLARALGAPLDGSDIFRLLERRLRAQRVLLLVDNCEHVLDTLVPLLARLLSALPGLQVLATSREALRLEGEFVLRLAPLAVPPEPDVGLQQALQSPAVRLLVERAESAGAPAFGEAQAAALVQVARQLDGIPLAIELVAGRLGVQSLDDLVLRLDDHLRLYSRGNRSALPRHRTLAAALDWSIALLDPDELRLFRRLSVFRGSFDVEAALSMVADAPDTDLALDALMALAGKSLVGFDAANPVSPYRLLDTTRSYAGRLLAESDEPESVLRRHALHMLDVMNAATAELPSLTVPQWHGRYAHRLDDVRYAIDQCLLRDELTTASDLKVASAPLWFHAAQIEEYRERLLQALQREEAQPRQDIETITWLRIALTNALWHTHGPVPEMQQACERAFASAHASRSPLLELQARWGMCIFQVTRGDYSAGLRNAHGLHDFAQASGEPAALNLAHRMMALTHHFCGDFQASHDHGAQALRVRLGKRRMRGNMFQVDANVASNTFLARTLWIQGAPDRARAASDEAIQDALASGQALSLCFALFGACPVALWSGDLPLAQQYVALMLRETTHRGLTFWNQWADCFALGLQALAQPGDAATPALQEAWQTWDEPRKEMLITFRPEFVDDAMVLRAWQGHGPWCAAEIWRAAGWRQQQRGALDEAESLYTRAHETARRQGAHLWAVRAALSLARLWQDTGRDGPARTVLEQALAPLEPGAVLEERHQAEALLAALHLR